MISLTSFSLDTFLSPLPAPPPSSFRDPVKRVTMLSMNTGLWSPRYDNEDLDKTIPDFHFNWLVDQLALAKKQRDQVILLSHIPPGKLYLPPFPLPSPPFAGMIQLMIPLLILVVVVTTLVIDLILQ